MHLVSATTRPGASILPQQTFRASQYSTTTAALAATSGAKTTPSVGPVGIGSIRSNVDTWDWLGSHYWRTRNASTSRVRLPAHAPRQICAGGSPAYGEANIEEKDDPIKSSSGRFGKGPALRSSHLLPERKVYAMSGNDPRRPSQSPNMHPNCARGEEMISQEDIQEIVANAKEELTKGIVDQVKRDVQYTIQRAITEEISGIVRTYCKENIAPNVHEALVGQQSLLIEACVNACQQAATNIAEAMGAQMAAKLSTTWERKKVLEALFGS